MSDAFQKDSTIESNMKVVGHRMSRISCVLFWDHKMKVHVHKVQVSCGFGCKSTLVVSVSVGTENVVVLFDLLIELVQEYLVTRTCWQSILWQVGLKKGLRSNTLLMMC